MKTIEAVSDAGSGPRPAADSAGFKVAICLLLFSLYYLWATLYRAGRKLFWYDEFASLNISRLADMGGIWKAVTTGVDFNPPLFYWLTRFAEAAVGQGHVGARLPEILGFLVFCICLFFIVLRRAGVLGALVAMLFPMVSHAYWYAYDARPHGIVLGCFGLSALCWSEAASRPESRWWSVVGIWVGLSAALSLHAYAIILWIPFLVAELVRFVQRRSVDVPVVSAVLAAAWGIAVLLPIARWQGGTPVKREFDWTNLLLLPRPYTTLLSPAVIPIASALVVVMACLLLGVARRRVPESTGPKPDASFVAFWGSVALLPLAVFLLSILTHSLPFDRYGAATVGAVAVALGLLVGRHLPQGMAVLVALVLMANILFDQVRFVRSPTIRETSSGYDISTYAPEFMEAFGLLRKGPADQPIVLLDKVEFPAYFYYAPEDLRRRMYYLNWDDAELNGAYYKRQVDCCGDRSQITRREDFLARNRSFLAFASSRSISRLGDLAAAGATVRIIAFDRERSLASVQF